MRLYESEGATREDINCLITADGVDKYRGISIEEALRLLVPNAPAPRAPRTPSESQDLLLLARWAWRLFACAGAGIRAAYGMLVLLVNWSTLNLALGGGQRSTVNFWLAAGAFGLAALLVKVA
jgi:hypothetical protein